MNPHDMNRVQNETGIPHVETLSQQLESWWLNSPVTPDGMTETEAIASDVTGILAIVQAHYEPLLAELRAENDRWRRMEQFVLNESHPIDGPAILSLVEQGAALGAENERLKEDLERIRNYWIEKGSECGDLRRENELLRQRPEVEHFGYDDGKTAEFMTGPDRRERKWTGRELFVAVDSSSEKQPMKEQTA